MAEGEGFGRLLKFGRRRRMDLSTPGTIFKDSAGRVYVVGANGEHRRINPSNSRKAEKKRRQRERRATQA